MEKPVNEQIREFLQILTEEKKIKIPAISSSTKIEYGRLRRLKDNRAQGNVEEYEAILKAYPDLSTTKQDEEDSPEGIDRGEIIDLKKTIAKVLSTNAKIMDTNATLMNSNARMDERLAELEKSNSKLKRSKEELEQEIERLKEEGRRLDAIRDELLKQVEEKLGIKLD